MYAKTADPWRLASAQNVYERDKYRDTLASLPRPRYRSAVEIGCSVGVLTAELAERCDAVLGVDLSETALTAARDRNRDRPNVAFARHRLPADGPAGPYDLVLLSEVLYFFDAGDLRRLAAWALGATAPGADLVLVNYLGPLRDYPLTGDHAVEVFTKALGSFASPMVSERRAQYRIDVLRRHAGEMAGVASS